MTQIFNRSCDKEKRQRRESPLAEQRLWLKLRNRRLLGYRFRRQYGVSPYVLDFFCPELKLAIEVNGTAIFRPVPASTIGKQLYIESLGIHVLRFTNREVFERPDDVAGGSRRLRE